VQRDTEYAQGSGAADYLTKPVQEETLLKRIRAILAARTTQGSGAEEAVPWATDA
jgi:DNA-binding response OmpR family regulator